MSRVRGGQAGRRKRSGGRKKIGKALKEMGEEESIENRAVHTPLGDNLATHKDIEIAMGWKGGTVGKKLPRRCVREDATEISEVKEGEWRNMSRFLERIVTVCAQILFPGDPEELLVRFAATFSRSYLQKTKENMLSETHT